MTASAPGDLHLLTAPNSYFEDFPIGRRMRHARGATIDEVENNLLSKLVMNTADVHWNEDVVPDGHPFGKGRLVFGLITGSMVFGLASQDTGENALAELGCHALRFLSPVHHGDTVYAYTEVMDARPADREDAGIVEFMHWGATHVGLLVFEGRRTVLMKRRGYSSASDPPPATT